MSLNSLIRPISTGLNLEELLVLCNPTVVQNVGGGTRTRDWRDGGCPSLSLSRFRHFRRRRGHYATLALPPVVSTSNCRRRGGAEESTSALLRVRALL